MFFNEERAEEFRAMRLNCEYIYGCIRHYYQNPLLKYHNHHHIEQCVYNYTTFEKNPKYNVIVALLYHDIVYFIQNYPGVNEQMSSDIFKAHYSHELIPIPKTLDQIAVSNMIRMTSIKHHMMTDDGLSEEIAGIKDLPEDYLEQLKAVLDADLSSMANNYFEFRTNQDNIVYENIAFQDCGFPSDKNRRTGLRKAAKFLQLFLDKDYIYRTEVARELYEKKARANISRFIDEMNRS